MVTFRETTLDEASAYAERHGIFFQTAAWADFRSLFKTAAFVGEDENGICLSCLLCKLPVYGTPYSIGQIPRGFVCDYSDRALVAAFTDYLKAYMKKHRVVYLIFDPMCDRKIDFEVVGDDIDPFFRSLGYVKNDGTALQPRTNYRLYIDPQNDPETEKQRLYNDFALRLKNDIAISRDRGVTVEKYHKEDMDRAVEIFYDLLVETTAKKGFGHRGLDYYKKFAKSLADYVTVYLYKYDSACDIAYTERVIEECRAHLDAIDAEIADEATTPQKRARLEPKRREAVKQLTATEKRLTIAREHTDDPYISAFFVIKLGDKSYNFYGANSAFLRDLKLTANYWDIILDCLDGKVTTFNMGGTLKLTTENVKDDPMYELYQYKKQYGGELSEMPGEYFLISRPKLFALLNGKLNYFRRIVFRF